MTSYLDIENEMRTKPYDTPDDGWDKDPSPYNKARLCMKQAFTIMSSKDEENDDFVGSLIDSIVVNWKDHLEKKANRP